MIEFEEPGNEYRLEKIKKRNHEVKVKVTTLFVIFILLVVLLVKNDFNLNFFKTHAAGLEEDCSPKYEYNWNDQEEVYLDKASTVLENNHSQLMELKGFHEAYVESEPVGFKGQKKPVIKIFFTDVSETPLRIPDRICGYRVSVVFK